MFEQSWWSEVVGRSVDRWKIRNLALGSLLGQCKPLLFLPIPFHASIYYHEDKVLVSWWIKSRVLYFENLNMKWLGLICSFVFRKQLFYLIFAGQWHC